MTDDLISRKILIEKLGISTECVDCQHKLNGLCLWKPNMVDVCEVITEMPSAEPKWIKVTERLPEDETLVLITADDGYIDTDKCFYMDDGSREWCSYNVVAWMPLPEPWKGDRRC